MLKQLLEQIVKFWMLVVLLQHQLVALADSLRLHVLITSCAKELATLLDHRYALVRGETRKCDKKEPLQALLAFPT